LKTRFARSLIPGFDRVWRLRRTLYFVWQSGAGWTIASAVIIAIQAVLPLLLLWVIKLIFDSVEEAIKAAASGGDPVSGEQVTSMLVLVAYAGGISIAQSLCTAGSRWVGEAQAEAVTDYMSGILHEKSVSVDLAYYENPVHRDKLHRAQRQAPFRPRRIVQGLLAFTLNLVSLLTMAAVLLTYHWSVLPILVVASLPGVLLRLRYSSQYYSWELQKTPRERYSAYTNILLTTDQFSKELRLFGLGELFKGRFRSLRKELRGEKLRVTRRRSVAEFVGEALAVVGVFGVLGHMSYGALMGAITVGTLVMYHGALQRAWSHLGLTLRHVSDLYEDNLFITDLFDFLEIREDVKSPADPKPLPAPESSTLRLDNVSFKYPHEDRLVLRDVSFEIAPGEHVALVGHNGCGKTTLVKLICRLYDPTGGAVRLDGVDLRELDLSEYRGSVGALMQDFCRYQATLRENVWMGDIRQDEKDPVIDRAILESGADKVVDGMPGGIETMLGTTFLGGHELSTGQWQKVALARMFAREAPILVLDEPTSAMDAEAEEELIRNLRKVAVGRTTLLISHRLAAVKQLDRIIYLEGGVVAESGTHDELMALGGGYAHLFDLQSRHYR
jgi:ATP-binding cassette subfamily B protein